MKEVLILITFHVKKKWMFVLCSEGGGKEKNKKEKAKEERK